MFIGVRAMWADNLPTGKTGASIRRSTDSRGGRHALRYLCHKVSARETRPLIAEHRTRNENCAERRHERRARKSAGKSVNSARRKYDILCGVSDQGATATGNRSGAVPRPSREKSANGMPRSHHDMLRETELTALN